MDLPVVVEHVPVQNNVTASCPFQDFNKEEQDSSGLKQILKQQEKPRASLGDYSEMERTSHDHYKMFS